MKKALTAVVVATLISVSAPAGAAASPNAVCVGDAASRFGAGEILAALAILGGWLFGTQIAATDCDPDFE